MLMDHNIHWIRRIAACLISALILAGCGSLPVEHYREASHLPPRKELNVPFYPQERDQCGPAALAMVFGYNGLSVSLSDLAKQVYLPGREGTLQVEMLAAVRSAGLLPYVLGNEPDALLEELAAGHPVIIFQNLRFRIFPDWHYAVVTGYDLAQRKIILHSGVDRRLVMNLDEFDRTWARAGRWALVVLPPTQLPASADETDFVETAVELEPVSPKSAGIAYRTALAKWPNDLIARIGLGNAAYGRQDYVEAEAEYRRAVKDHPHSGDAWNNLAQVLHDLGRFQDALAAINHAVKIGGNRKPIYELTMKSIQNDMSHQPSNVKQSNSAM
jgi:hypothetical protein